MQERLFLSSLCESAPLSLLQVFLWNAVDSRHQMMISLVSRSADRRRISPSILLHQDRVIAFHCHADAGARKAEKKNGSRDEVRREAPHFSWG